MTGKMKDVLVFIIVLLILTILCKNIFENFVQMIKFFCFGYILANKVHGV